MSDKPILIVDNEDNPIGQASMKEAWESGSFHRIVRIIVEDGNGYLLLQKRSKDMDTYPGCWDNSAAGHVDAGEDNLTAAKRELSEELGIDVNLIELGRYQSNQKLESKKIHRFNIVFRAVVDRKLKINIDDKEVASIKWMKLDEVKGLLKASPDDFTDGMHDVISRFYK